MLVIKTDSQEMEVKVGSHVYFSETDSFVEWEDLPPALCQQFSELEHINDMAIDVYKEQTNPHGMLSHLSKLLMSKCKDFQSRFIAWTLEHASMQ